MALSEIGREGGRAVFAVLSDDEDLHARAAQLGPRCGLKVTPGAITPTHTVNPIPAGREHASAPVLVSGTLASGPRAGFEKMFEVLSVSGDSREAALARQGLMALDGASPAHEIPCGPHVLRPGCVDRGMRPLVMGVLNVTPDSFSDGGRYADLPSAAARGVEMAEQGAQIIDVGGESTRPGSQSVSAEEESRRVLPVIESLAGKIGVPISIDTTKAEVARRAAAAGATMLNDISGMTMDPLMPSLAAGLGIPVILNHIRGIPRTMQDSPSFEHVVLQVLLDLAVRVRAAVEAGVAPSKIVVDPGVGFGKRVEDNLAILRHLRIFRSLGCPVLVGVSRKSFLGAITSRAVSDRLAATLAAETLAAAAGADVIRTHDPASTLDALKVALSVAGTPVSL